jgi:conjugative relaxase-like TrwC/TraI family protein
MLSMSPISSSEVAVSYYEKDDYYAAGGNDPDAQGQWLGEGAERLGLAGNVDRDVFKDLLDGRMPDGTQLGVVREAGGEREHRPGYDLTFSAPKSVTLAALVGGDKRVIEAHQRATQSAVGWLETTAAATRVKVDGEIVREDTGNLLVATFQHDTNRNHDPQLHTHAVVLNATQRADGKWRSIESLHLFESKMGAGAVYRSALAIELQKLGYEIASTDRDGAFEIAGVSPEAIHEFSTRRQEIVESLMSRGLSGPEASAQAALMTRNSKTPENRSELGQEWSERASSVGFDASRLVDQARERGDVSQAATAGDIARALRNALSRLSDQEAAFKHSDLVRWTLANGMGRISVEQAEHAIQREAAAGRLFGASVGAQHGWTTTSAIQQELRISSAIENGRDAVVAAYSSRDAAVALASTPLNGGQRAAAEMILSSSDRFVGVLGRPGTGKTFMLSSVRTALSERGFEVVGMAANAEAARQLQESAGIASGTIHKHLRVAGADLSRMSAGPAQAADIQSRYSKQVWVIDEASQVSNSAMRRVTTLAEKLGARVVLVGDTAQLGAIEAGKPFSRMLSAGMRSAEMDEIRRQTDSRHVAAVRDVIGGDISAAMEKLRPETREIQDRDARLSAILDDWKAAGSDRDKVLMLSARNSTRTDLNDRARSILRGEGALRGENVAQQLLSAYSTRADTALASSYKAGQVVHFPRALSSLGIERGAYVRVESVDTRAGVVQLDVNGQRVAWAPSLIGGGTKQPPQIFVPRETSLAPGERIVWSKNNTALGLTNGQRLTVLRTDAKRMTVRTEDGRQVEVDRSTESGRHWEHGYAGTIYKSQGQTADRVLVDASSSDKQLLSQKAFLVAVSRQKSSLTIYTDSAEKLTRSVESSLGEKLSAVESRRDGSLDLLRAADRAFDRYEQNRAAERAPPARSPSRGMDFER